LGLPAAFAFISNNGWDEALILAAGAALVASLYFWIGWRNFHYRLDGDGVTISRGVFHRTRRTIPYERVQDIDIERGPLHRLFGLARLRIETGGGDKDEGLIESVTVAEAERLRSEVRAGRGAVVETTHHEAPVVFAMPLPRVLLAGLFGFSLAWIAGLFVLLQAFEDWLPFDLYDPGRWLGLVDEGGRRATPGAVAAVLLVALLLGLVTGMLRAAARDFGFTLRSDGGRFQRIRGLFTRSETVLPKRRIQLARIRTGPIRRRSGWFALSFQTLSAGKDGGGQEAVAPLARSDEIDAILAAQGGLARIDEAALEMVSSRHFIRVAVGAVAMPAAAIIVGGFIFPLVWIAAALLPGALISALLQRHFHRFAFVDGLLHIRRRVWRQQHWIIPVGKIQVLALNRSWLQRRLGIATLLVDTAGAADLDAPRIVDLGEARARSLSAALREAAESGFYSGRKSGTER